MATAFNYMSTWCTHSAQWRCQTTSALVSTTLFLLLPLTLTPPLSASATSVDDIHCLKLKTPGATFPAGDINIEYGNPLEIYCILDPKKTDRNASSLIFENINKEVPQEYLEIVNSTTLRLYIERPAPSHSMYYCRLRAEPEKNLPAETVCLNDVAVGYKPQEVKNFSCISMNWENLTCTWDMPINYVKTTTKLEYYLPGRAGGRFFYPCPDRMEKHENKCFWDRSTSVVYRQPYDYYFFRMTIANLFGNITQKFKFHHYAYVIPSKPVNCTVLNKTSNSVFIQWSVGFPMQNFPPGVMQKVEYQSQWDSRDTWHSVDVSHLNRKAKTHSLNITGLKYAHSFYDIRIYMKSPDATGEDKWSKPASLTVKTLPEVPGAPPKTDIGSFEVSRGLPFRDIYVYWQRIPEFLTNGDHFEYQVFNVNDSGFESLLKPDESEKAYARFKSLEFRDYHLRIYSANEKGRSKRGSDVFIPAVHDIVPEPLTFTKIAFDNGIYELSWKIPTDHSKIDNYTIFWCDNKKDRPFQCNGYLNWTYVGKDTFIKNITVPEDKVYQFAVSANSHNSSSGMVWASCTVIHNKVVGKMKSVWINSIGSTFIELGWKLECSDRVGVVKGFRIYYCPLASPHAKECKGGVKSNTTIMGDPPLTGHGNVTGLKPYTTYMLSVSVLTKSGEGLQSDVLFNTTLEDAPDPPRNVRVSNLTNTSMLVAWEPPLNTNGVLRPYIVQYSSMEGTGQIESSDLRVTLKNLRSYFFYNVSVAARTTISSSFVFAPVVRTLVGVPGVVEQPVISPVSSSSNLNKSQMSVNWTRPQNPRGKIDFYEVMLTQLNENANESEIRRVYSNSIVVEMECEGVKHMGQSLRYMVYVRAVNVRIEEDKNVTLRGPWSSPGLRSCYNSGFPEYVQFCIILFIMMAVVSALFGFAYFAKRFYKFCRKCMDVPVKLPPPFNTQTNEKDVESHKRMHGLQIEVEKLDVDSNIYHSAPAPDQELLLLKKAENDCDGDGDSSGCSSAHESVSSSLTSGTHISDSGTEDQPESPPTLRQRIISSGRDGGRLLPDQYVISGVSETSPNTTESDLAYSRFVNRDGTGYCVVGNAPKSYTRVGLLSSTQIPSTISSGYVSHPPIQSDGKNSVSVAPSAPPSKGYVRAGPMPTGQSPSEKHPSTSYCKLGVTNEFVKLPSTSKSPSEL